MLKRGLSGKISVPRNKSRNIAQYPRLVRKTHQNKYEIRIADWINGRLTAGSGAVFSDGDIRAGKYLIEHKYKNKKKSISLAYSVYEKIYRQATLRSLVPVLVISFPNNLDFCVMDIDDLYDSLPRTRIKFMTPDVVLYATVHVNAEEFLEGMTSLRGLDPSCIPARHLSPAPLKSKLPPKSLVLIQFDDFRRFASGLDKPSNT